MFIANLKRFQLSLILLFVFLVIVVVGFLNRTSILPGKSLGEKTVTSVASINYQDYLASVKNVGFEKAYVELKKRFPNNDTRAHDYAHVIGIVAFEDRGMDGMNVCDTAYNYGCYHGFIEAFLLKNDVSKVSQIENACISLGIVHSPSCLHGIGHGVMANRSYNLEIALADCDYLQETSRMYCFDGVFMERNTPSMLANTAPLLLAEETLLEPCASLAEVYKKQCWRNQVFAWFRYFKNNSQQVNQQCSLIYETYQNICFESVGLQIAMTAGTEDSIVSACKSLQGSVYDYCLMGVMKEILFEGRAVPVAQRLCAYISSVNTGLCQQTYSEHFDQYKKRFSR